MVNIHPGTALVERKLDVALRIVIRFVAEIVEWRMQSSRYLPEPAVVCEFISETRACSRDDAVVFELCDAIHEAKGCFAVSELDRSQAVCLLHERFLLLFI